MKFQQPNCLQFTQQPLCALASYFNGEVESAAGAAAAPKWGLNSLETEVLLTMVGWMDASIFT